MALNNSSLSNPTGFGLNNEAFIQSSTTIPLNSNFRSGGLNATLNGNGLINSHPLSPTPTTGFLPPNKLYTTSAPRVGNGQLALTIGIRTPCLGPVPRVHVQTLEDHHQYYPGVTEVSTTEIKTIRFLTPTSVLDCILQPSSSMSYDAVYRYSNETANRLIRALAIRDNGYNDMRNVPQTLSVFPSASNVQLNFHQLVSPMAVGMDGWSLTGVPILPQNIDLNEVPPMDNELTLVPTEEVLNPEPVNVYVDKHNHNEEARVRRPRKRVHGETSQAAEDEIDGSDHNVVGNDGRTHSLPCRKYGPYKCPRSRCRRTFPTSQQFAAHTLSHYARETAVQRRRRLLARSRNVIHRLRVGHHTTHGFSVWPREAVESFRKTRRQVAPAVKAKIVVKTEPEESGGENEVERKVPYVPHLNLYPLHPICKKSYPAI